MSNRIVLPAVLIAVAWVAARVAIAQLSSTPAAGGPVLDDGPPRLMDCPASPNCHGSFATREDQYVEPLEVDPAVADGRLIERAVSRLTETSSATVASQTDDYAHLEYRSRVFGFIDDVELLLDAERALLHVRSASRLGYSDLGANRRRIESLRRELESVLRGT